MPKSRGIMAPKRFWLEWEEDFLRKNYADSLTVDLAQVLDTTIKRVLAKANAMGLHKSIALISETARERTSRPDHGSKRTQIKPGDTPWNKGVPGSTGLHPNTRAKQFKPGIRPHTWVPIGSYRVIEGATLERKVNDLPGPNHIRWKPVARLVWEAEHGPVPPGCAVVFKPGRQSIKAEDITLDAVELLTREGLMRRNSYHTNLPPELARVVQLRAVLTRTINRKTKEGTTA